MALPNNPSRDAIHAELGCSTYTGGNNLNGMSDYVFGAGSYSRDAFGTYGTPLVSSLSATGGNNKITVTFNLDNNGGLSCTFIAQYWVKTNEVSPSPYYEETLGSSSTEGSHTYDITSNISNGTTYEVRVTAYNKFNNDTSNLPAPRNPSPCYDFTNTAEATAQQPKLSTPSIASESRVADFNTDAYISLSADGNQDDITLNFRINSGTANTPTRNCSAGITTTTPEINTQMDQFIDSGDTVEFRAKATGTGYTDSDWSSWTTITHGTIKTCPL